MASWIAKTIFAGAVLFLTLVVGGAAMYFGFAPGPQLDRSFQAWEAVNKMRRQQGRPFNAGGIFPVDHDFRGVTRGDPALWQDGYTLYSTAHGQTVRLVDMQGQEAHRWELSYHDLWDEDSMVQNLVPERFIYVRNAKLYPNGDLLLSFSAWTTTPFGFGIAKIDRDSNVIWHNLRPIHHSFAENEDGTIYALDHIVMDDGPDWLPEVTGPYLDDGISIFAPDGEYIRRISVLESLKNSAYIPAIKVLATLNAGDGLGDLLHANDVDVLTTSLAPAFPFAEAGNLLISMREINAIAIIDVDTEAVKWFARGDWYAQHDPDFLPNGNILLFNNIDMQLDTEGYRASSVIEFNPKTREVVWTYRGNGDDRFFTAARGSQQRQPNGNTLITESQSGRIFEVTPDGKVVWEYFNPDRVEDQRPHLPSIFWATRYPPEAIDFEFNKLAIQPDQVFP